MKVYLWATELLYGPLAWAYDAVAWIVSFGYWSRWRLDVLAYAQAGSVLEIGFGTGELLIALAERGYPVTGLELSPQMHKVTDRKLRKSKLPIKRVRAMTEAMPFKSGAFDNLIATFPSNYILKEETLYEIKRVLSREGRCVMVGLGVQFKSCLRRGLTNLWIGRGMDAMIKRFIQETEKVGLLATPVNHQADAYTLPVLILERSDAA